MIPAIINKPTTVVPITQFHLYQWGYGGELQIGNGTTNNQPSPLLSPAYLVKKAAKGGSVNAIIKNDNTLLVWGLNANGQLGLGDTANRASPASLNGSPVWADLDVSNYGIIGLKQNGDVWTGGQNVSNSLGLGTDGSYAFQLAIQNAQKVCIGSDQYGFGGTMVILNDGTVWYAGDNQFGQANNTPNTPANFSVFTQIANNSFGFVDIQSEGIYNLALDGNGHVWGRGYNNEGQLGIGNSTHPITAWTQQAGGDVFTKILTSARYTFGLKADGSIWAWGVRNASWGLSSSGSAFSAAPVLVQNGPYIDFNISRFGVGASAIPGVATAFGIKANGDLEAWGYNNTAQFGNGVTSGPSTSPVFIDTGFVGFPKGAYANFSQGFGGGCAFKP